MANNDFYLSAAQQRLNVIAAEEQAALADMATYRAGGQVEEAASAIQNYANLQAEKQNLTALCQSYITSQQAPQQREISPEERLARRPEHMDWTDVVELTRTSRHAKDIKADDPNLLSGWREAQRRRARGE